MAEGEGGRRESGWSVNVGQWGLEIRDDARNADLTATHLKQLSGRAGIEKATTNLRANEEVSDAESATANDERATDRGSHAHEQLHRPQLPKLSRRWPRM